MVTRGYFETELFEVQTLISRMGVLVETSISQTIFALINNDKVIAEKIIMEDDVIDNMEREIESKCIDIIARQQPVARDLRDVTSALKLITDLERIADHASDISKKILLLPNARRVLVHYDLVSMAEIAKGMIKGALDAYVSRSVDLANETIAEDDKVDELYDKIKNEFVHLMSVDTENINQYVELLFVCKYFERIADHAQNVAEWVIYDVVGEHL